MQMKCIFHLQICSFQKKYHALAQKEDEASAILLNGEDMLSRCQEGDTTQLRENLAKLRSKIDDTRQKADKKKVKLETC